MRIDSRVRFTPDSSLLTTNKKREERTKHFSGLSDEQNWASCCDSACTSNGGSCQDNSNYCGGSYSSGKCGGPSSRQCCSTSSTGGGGGCKRVEFHFSETIDLTKYKNALLKLTLFLLCGKDFFVLSSLTLTVTAVTAHTAIILFIFL